MTLAAAEARFRANGRGPTTVVDALEAFGPCSAAELAAILDYHEDTVWLLLCPLISTRRVGRVDERPFPIALWRLQ